MNGDAKRQARAMAARSLADVFATIPATFRLPVTLNAPGGVDIVVEFEFKTRKADELSAYIERLAGMPDEKAIAEACVGWDLDDKFGPAAIKKLVATVPSAGHSVVRAYLDAQYGSR